MAKKISDLAAAAALDGTELSETVQAGVNVKVPLGSITPPGYIDGLKMQWVSANALTVTSGAAYIPSLGRVLRVPASIAKAGLALAASTWYHVYLWLNGANADVEIVTAVPAAPYVGTARAKTGDTSRRYVGSILTDASSQIIPFAMNGMRISYVPPAGATGTVPYRILSAGAATSVTAVAGSGIIPITSQLGQLRIQNNGSSAAGVGPGAPFSNAITTGPGSNNAPWVLDCASGTDQSFVYFNTTSGGSLFIDVTGYIYER